jgi:hypothetical protein
MKTYQILEPTDQLQEGDAYVEQLPNFAGARLVNVSDNDFGNIVKGKLVLYLRPIPPPQWQTGEIPEPTGPSVLKLELNVVGGGVEYLFAFYDKWVNQERDIEYDINETVKNSRTFHDGETRHNHYTGRWYIQQIELPL